MADQDSVAQCRSEKGCGWNLNCGPAGFPLRLALNLRHELDRTGLRNTIEGLGGGVLELATGVLDLQA